MFVKSKLNLEATQRGSGVQCRGMTFEFFVLSWQCIGGYDCQRKVLNVVQLEMNQLIEWLQRIGG